MIKSENSLFSVLKQKVEKILSFRKFSKFFMFITIFMRKTLNFSEKNIDEKYFGPELFYIILSRNFDINL